MRRVLLLFVMFFAVAGLLALSATPSQAVHAGAGPLTCGNCHTMHSSQGNTYGMTMGTSSGVIKLLRVSETSTCPETDLCLFCHAENGPGASTVQGTGVWETTAPKVYLTNGTWAEGSDFSSIGAGGDFRYVGTFNNGTFIAQGQDLTSDANGPSGGYGHSLCEQDMDPPGGNSGDPSNVTVTMTGRFFCVNCHDPHGVPVTVPNINAYRNLRGNIVTQGDGKSWVSDIGGSYVGGVAGSASDGTSPLSITNIWPIWRSDPLQNNYINDGSDSAQMSEFCSQCHGKWHEALTTDNNEGTDWRRHPVDNVLVDTSPLSGSGRTIVDWTHLDGVAPGNIVPASGGPGYYADDDGDKVFCLSCHFPHAGPYYDALRWDYQQSVEVGSQVGKGLGSLIGCQQCHNRGGIFGT